MSNVNKGVSKLASVLHKQMARQANKAQGVVAERGEIVSGKKLKLYSIPDSILDKDDYSVCVTVQEIRPLKVGDRVLILWTNDGEPVVIDRIISGDEAPTESILNEYSKKS